MSDNPPPPPGGGYTPPPPPPGGGWTPPPGDYGQSGYGGYAAPQQNQKALWSLIIGIVSVPLGCYACFGWVGIAAVILGGNARKEIAASGGAQTGEGQAKAGVILGWVGIVLGTIVLIVNIILLVSGEGLRYNLNTN